MVPLPVRGDPSGRESPMGSRREEKSGPRTILGPARTVLPVVDWPRPGTHARSPGSRAIRGKAYRQSLGHVCTMTSSPSGDSLVVDIRDSRFIVGAHQHMVTSQVWDLETRPASPNNWNAKWDGDHSTDRGQGCHPGFLFQGPVLGAPCRRITSTSTRTVSTCLRHVGTAVWPWSCEACFSSEKTPWSWTTTLWVSCTAGQEVG